jgi:hypothetical protein
VTRGSQRLLKCAFSLHSSGMTDKMQCFMTESETFTIYTGKTGAKSLVVFDVACCGVIFALHHTQNI